MLRDELSYLDFSVVALQESIQLLVLQIWFDLFSCETLVKFHCIQL